MTKAEEIKKIFDTKPGKQKSYDEAISHIKWCVENYNDTSASLMDLSKECKVKLKQDGFHLYDPFYLFDIFTNRTLTFIYWERPWWKFW